MRSFSQTILVGHLGHEPETRYTSSGVACMEFSLATSVSWKGKDSGEWKDRVEWHKVRAWRPSDWLQRTLHKGSLVHVVGRNQTRKWEDRNGVTRYTTEVVADIVNLLEKRGDSAGRDRDDDNDAAEPPYRAPAPAGEITAGVDEDDVPF